ncbi:efflux transporter outer membrane subunit [Propionivibrio limicola]|uniref:efflux transporter outer membrane subunit n=1 Tax=Propionivibrio limicola TaxID=167645 RepID=UPI0012927F48|nr:efflux transporter outer membrane subunit [Propionivibrio limicola]
MIVKDSPRFSRSLTAMATALALQLGACTIHEPTSLPRMQLPEKWSESVPTGAALTGVEADWWKGFASTELNRLVDIALKDNPDLLISAERIRQAEIALGITQASRLPNVGLSAGSSQSRRTPDGESTTRTEASSLGVSVSYEVDLWGKIAANVAAGEASLKSTRFDYEASRLSLIASVASVHFQSLTASERLRIAQENLSLAQRILAIVEARHRNGIATRLDVSQQRTTVLSAQAALIPLAVQVRQLHSALALLLGQIPQQAAFADEELSRLSIPVIAPEMPPALLTRRPDIAAAEATLAANDANVAAARAALLPSASLSLSGSLSSAVLLDLASPTRSVSTALSLAQNIFDGGKLRLQTESARSQRAVQIITYSKTVRTALKEVDDGLGNIEKSERQEAAQQAVLEQSSRSLRLAGLQYREGTGQLLSVLEAQKTVFSARDQLATLRLARLQAVIDLSKALGGGWRNEL